MTSHIRTFLTGLFALLTALLLAFAPVAANAALSGYQLFTDQYGDDAQTRMVALADVQGPGTEYLRELNKVATGDVSYGAEAELINVDHAETTRQAGVLTKLAIALITQNPWDAFFLNAGADAAISGEVDLKNIAKDAAFTAAMSGFKVGDVGFSGATNQLAGKFGINELSDAGFGTGKKFSEHWLATSALDAGLTGTAQTVLYDGNLRDNVLNSFTNSVISEGTAYAQNLVGDVKGKDGSLLGVIGHAGVGCISADLRGGNCGQGAFTAASAEFFTGVVDRETGDMDATKEVMAKWFNPTLAALSSGGDVGQFGTNQGIADSQLKNNYLFHAQRSRVEKLIDDLNLCDVGAENCTTDERNSKITELQMLQDLSDQQTQDMIKACSNGPSDACKAHIDAAEGFEEWAWYGPYNEIGKPTGYVPSMFQASTGTDQGVENQLNLDLLALDYMRNIQNGSMTSEQASEALARDLQSMDGKYKIAGGIIGAVGTGACLYTKISCVLGLISAIPAADRAYEGVVTAISGEDQLSAIEAAAKAAGVKDPEALRDDIETGVAIVTVGAGGTLLVYKGGKFVANLGKHADEVIPPAPNKTQLIEDLVIGGTKVTPENVVEIRKLPNGKTVWLETGTATGPRPAGLNHIVADHGTDFANKGIAEADIPDALFTALKDGKIVGYQGAGTGRPIYQYDYKGQTQHTAITVGDNGFIVGANPTSGP